MATSDEIRLRCLEAARPDNLTNNQDGKLIIERARLFEAYVVGEGQATKAPSQANTLSLPPKTGHAPSAPAPRSK